MEQRLLTKSQAAKYLGISIRTLHKWIKRGMVNPIMIPGGHSKYDINDLDRLIQESKTTN